MSSSPDSGIGGSCSPSDSQLESLAPDPVTQQSSPRSTDAYALSMQAWHLDAFKAATAKGRRLAAAAAAADASGSLNLDKLKLESAPSTPA